MSYLRTDLAGRLALITGAARGMGAAHAKALATQGADVIITDLDGGELEATAKGIRSDTGRTVTAVVADLTTNDAVDTISTTVSAAGGVLDIVVHNAGIMHDWNGFRDTPTQNLEPYFGVNVLAPYRLTRALLPQIERSTAGRIIFINSQWGQQPDGHSYGYMIAKSAQLGFMRALAKELVAEKILVNAIAPGAIHTRMVPDDVYDIELAAVPLGRLGEADEIADAVVFLASDAASFITGQTLAVNGGAHIPSA
ncbi:SDR family NAD(P)-dependent oxidoreductase [Gordonia sp. CPCC 205515]|uniref:SDR family NAD(P)-dependent oxidoreductase n=1 Tax=Gordonia sp. CPCC 205515 TaxID=3140791 RepID=UPI003AF3645C